MRGPPCPVASHIHTVTRPVTHRQVHTPYLSHRTHAHTCTCTTHTHAHPPSTRVHTPHHTPPFEHPFAAPWRLGPGRTCTRAGAQGGSVRARWVSGQACVSSPVCQGVSAHAHGARLRPSPVTAQSHPSPGVSAHKLVSLRLCLKPTCELFSQTQWLPEI